VSFEPSVNVAVTASGAFDTDYRRSIVGILTKKLQRAPKRVPRLFVNCPLPSASSRSAARTGSFHAMWRSGE
jgi:hypothetical protein